MQRFWEKVERLGPDDCWLWTKALRGEYGAFKLNGKVVGAHVVAWELHNEAIATKGMDVCHTCDNPPCCNPAHLFLGTRRENVMDAVTKGRQVCPEGRRFDRESNLSPKTKISVEQTEQIRNRYTAGGITMQTLADEIGVDKSRVWQVVHGR